MNDKVIEKTTETHRNQPTVETVREKETHIDHRPGDNAPGVAVERTREVREE